MVWDVCHALIGNICLWGVSFLDDIICKVICLADYIMILVISQCFVNCGFLCSGHHSLDF